MSGVIKDRSLGLRISEDDNRLLEDAVKKGLASSKGEVVRKLIDINLRKATVENELKLQIRKILDDAPMAFVLYLYRRMSYLTMTRKDLYQEACLIASALRELVGATAEPGG